MSNQQSPNGPRFLGRRDLLQIGSLACLGLGLTGVFRAETARGAQTLGQAPKVRLRSCILIFCNGGPSHLDTFDMKPDALMQAAALLSAVVLAVPPAPLLDRPARHNHETGAHAHETGAG